MGALTTPNVKYPLVASYNPRGNSGQEAITAGLDQRKINSYYEVVQNSASKMQTVYLSKRPPAYPGVLDYGVATQTTYLIGLKPGRYDDSFEQGPEQVNATNFWVYAVSSNTCFAVEGGGSGIPVLASTNYVPAYIDRTAISGLDYAVAQVTHTSQQQRVFYASTSSVAAFTEISSATFTSLNLTGKMEFMDGYAFATDGSTQRIYNSELNTLDVWLPLNFIAKQIQQDGIRTLARLGKRIVCFGYGTSEVFGNAGTAVGSPLVSIPDMSARVGNAVPHYAVLDNKLYFISNISGSNGGLWAFDGNSFGQVSKGPFNKVIDALRDDKLIYGLRTITWAGNGGLAIQTTHVSSNPQRWYMYFPAWGDWFEWNSTVFAPPNSGKFFIGVSSAAKHKIYSFNDTDNEGSQVDANNDTGAYQFLHQFQIPKDGNTFHKMDMCQLIGDTVTSVGVPPHNRGLISVMFSDDDGRTFSASSRTIDMTTAEKMTTRCGSYANRVVRLEYTGEGRVRLEKFAAKVTK